MRTLLTIRDHDLHPEVPVVGTADFWHRRAARAVVMNDHGEVFLLNVGLHDYHKLPGGGVDKGETILQALHRELLEEIGCKVEVVGEIGKIVEHRNKYKLTQTSYCYLARQIGPQASPAFDPGEIADGMEEAKMANLAAAIARLEQDAPDDYEGAFIQRRDLAFLRAAEQLAN